MGISDSEGVQYLRFQSPHRNDRGRFTGVFGLVNNLAREGRLSEEQEAFRRLNNKWYDAAYTDPSTIDPTVYDVTGTTTLIRSDLPAGTDYVVASETMFGRFTNHRDQFPDQAARYGRLFGALDLVQEFPNGADSIRIYAVPAGFVAP